MATTLQTARFPRNSLAHRQSVGARRLVVAFSKYASETIRLLEQEEKRLCAEFHVPGLPIADLCSLVRALDTVRDRRRITLGIPLPNGAQRRTLQLPQDGPVDVDLLPENGAEYRNPVADASHTHAQGADAQPTA